MSKIVVAYASAGSGHQRAAQAIYQCLQKDQPELNACLIDIVEYTTPLFACFYSRGYSFLVTHLSFIWAAGYYLTSLRFISRIFHFISRLHCRRFIKFIIGQQPDIILTTHFFPSEVIAYLKQKGRIKSRLVVVMTDFNPHTLWMVKNYDDYIAGSDYTAQALISRGIEQAKVKVLGIPISQDFLVRYPEAEGPRDFTALLVTGSFGFALTERAVDMLQSQISLIVVCGNNRRLYNRLKRKHYAGVRLFGFSNEMPRLMSQADIIITKAGGLTIAEALAMQLPLIFICNIPGQESENARILESCGCAINAGGLKSLKNMVSELMASPQRLDLLRANIDKIKKPNAAREICRYVIRGPDLWNDSEHKSDGRV